MRSLGRSWPIHFLGTGNCHLMIFATTAGSGKMRPIDVPQTNESKETWAMKPVQHIPSWMWLLSNLMALSTVIAIDNIRFICKTCNTMCREKFTQKGPSNSGPLCGPCFPPCNENHVVKKTSNQAPLRVFPRALIPRPRK